MERTTNQKRKKKKKKAKAAKVRKIWKKTNNKFESKFPLYLLPHMCSFLNWQDQLPLLVINRSFHNALKDHFSTLFEKCTKEIEQHWNDMARNIHWPSCGGDRSCEGCTNQDSEEFQCSLTKRTH